MSDDQIARAREIAKQHGCEIGLVVDGAFTISVQKACSDSLEQKRERLAVCRSALIDAGLIPSAPPS